MTLAITVLALAAPAAPTVDEPYWMQRDCAHFHRAPVARSWLKRHVRSTRPRLDSERIRRIKVCVPTQEGAQRLRSLVKRWRAWRHEYIQLWHIRFNRLARWARNWAVSTGACESGNDPRAATGNGFYGAHQWLPSTWAAADSTGIWVTNASWFHQAVVAVHWLYVAGDEQWPVCGD